MGLLRTWPDEVCIVPRLKEHLCVIQKAYEEVGHFWPLSHIFQVQYLWRELQSYIQLIVTKCIVCGQVWMLINALVPQ